MNRLDTIEETQLRNNIPDFQPGDTVRVHVRIKESETKERLQAFEGVCIARKHGGARETITVRKTSFGVGVERIFPLHATIIDHIDVVKKGHVRRAKLYYLRELRGKAARIRERDTRPKRLRLPQPALVRKRPQLTANLRSTKNRVAVGVSAKRRRGQNCREMNILLT